MKMHEAHGFDVICAVLLLLVGWNLPKWGQVWVILGYEGIVLVVKAQLHNQVFPALARCFSYVKPSSTHGVLLKKITLERGFSFFTSCREKETKNLTAVIEKIHYLRKMCCRV